MPSPFPPAITRRVASWRLLLAGLLLAVLAGWQGWQCTDGTMPTPLSGHMINHHHAEPAAAFDHGHPPGGTTMASACMSVLATLAAAMFLLAVPRLPTGLWAVTAVWRTLLRTLALRPPALASMGVLRI